MKTISQGKESLLPLFWRLKTLPPFHRLCRQVLILGCSLLLASPVFAARQAEYLDRGVVALPSGTGIYIGWRMLGDDPANIGFHVYRNNTRITASPISNSFTRISKPPFKRRGSLWHTKAPHTNKIPTATCTVYTASQPVLKDLNTDNGTAIRAISAKLRHNELVNVCRISLSCCCNSVVEAL